MKGKRILAAALGTLMALTLAISALTAILDGMGASGELMLSMMERHAPSEDTGLPAEEYPGMAKMVTDYLAGRNDVFQYTWTDENGAERVCFHDYEQQHMADCRALFVLDRMVLLAGVAALVAVSGCLWLLRAYARQALTGFLAGTGVVLAGVTALVIWGAADFEGLFVLFHRISFDNGLWLLNPRTDLLIRLMPTTFFIHYAVLLGGTWLGILCLMGGAGLAIRRALRRRDMRGKPDDL